MTIYSDDGGLKTTAERAGLSVVGLADLELPPALMQKELFPKSEDSGGPVKGD